MAKDYIIGGVTIQGLGLSGARAVGERLVIAQSEARKKIQGNNPYLQSSDIQAYAGDTPIGSSILGTAVMTDVTFDSVTYTDSQNNEVTTPKLKFDAILVDVTLPRNIVKTEIQGRSGTVKEYIGEGDAQISFRGIITGPNNHYPIDEVAALKRLIKAPVSIPVISAYLNNLDIDTIVFEDRTLGQDEGGYSYQAFTLNAIQDIAQELNIL